MKEKISSALIQLIADTKGKVNVYLYAYGTAPQMSRNEKNISSAVRDGNEINLILYETKEEDQYEKMSQAILQAKVFFEEIRDELEFDSKHPSFFKALRARVELAKSYF